jgi:hypothetical protein
MTIQLVVELEARSLSPQARAQPFRQLLKPLSQLASLLEHTNFILTEAALHLLLQLSKEDAILFQLGHKLVAYLQVSNSIKNYF